MMMASPMTTSAAAATLADEERDDLAVEVPVVHGEGHERQIGRIEHELDAHEHDDGRCAE